MGSENHERFERQVGKLLRPGFMASGVQVSKCNGCQALVAEEDEARHLCLADLIADEIRAARGEDPAVGSGEVVPGPTADDVQALREGADYDDLTDAAFGPMPYVYARTIAEEITGGRRA